MGILGKLLLVFNLLASGGLVYLAGQDWAKRQEVTAVALRHSLLLSGLPVEGGQPAGDGSVPLNVELPSGGLRVESVTPALLQSHFQGFDGGTTFGAAGPPPASQLDEVKRVEAKLDALLVSAQPAERLRLLCGQTLPDGSFVPGLLTRLAESYEERDLLRRLADPASGMVDGADTPATASARAEALAKRRFAAVTAAPNPAAAAARAQQLKDASDAAKAAPTDKAARRKLDDVLADGSLDTAADDGDRRRRAAHLLTFLDESAAWQQRVVRVVGLPAYRDALVDQADRLRDIAWAVESEIKADQAVFFAEYGQLQQLAANRQTLLDAQKVVEAGLADQKARDQEALTQRMAQRAARETVLADLKKQVADQLAAQKQVETQLFAVQKRVGQMLDDNFRLEDKLADAEAKALPAAKVGK